MAKKKGGHHHTGPIRHGPMHNASMGLGGKDPHAHPSHNEANKEHGTEEGMSPAGDGKEDEGCCEGLTGGNQEEY